LRGWNFAVTKIKSQATLPYIISREKSTTTAQTTPVAMKASFSSPHLSRTADLSAPWWPDMQPKKPDRAPPRGRYFLSNLIRASSDGTSSRNANRKIRLPKTSLMVSTSKTCVPIVYDTRIGRSLSFVRMTAPIAAMIAPGMMNLMTT